MDKMTGFLLLLAYIITVGVGSFLQKFVMDKVTPYQLEVITAIGMLVVSIPALLIAQKSLTLPVRTAPLALVVGLCFAVGSFAYVLAVARLPLTIAAPVSTAYVLVAVVLSAIFLKEPITVLKVVGIFLTVTGAAILSIR
jgi:drug/metabolite transporter (DMT)-like permease